MSWESHQSQRLDNPVNGFHYINSETVQNLTGDPNHNKSLLEKCLGSGNQPINYAPVIFLVPFGQNTYFLALFDFSEGKALVLGRHGPGGPDFISVHAEWESWNGPVLWKRISGAFNWHNEKTEERPIVVVYEENWIPVRLCIRLI